MKKNVLLAFVLVFLSLAVVVRFIRPVVSYSTETELLMEVDPPVRNIDSGKNFSTIQGAINDNETLNGHTILVDAGTYYEHVVVNKSVSLIGENKHNTIIDGSSIGTVVKITANNVNISGFTIQNSHITPPDVAATPSGSSGIYVDISIGNNISHNIITKNTFGIFLYRSRNSILSDNIASSNTWDGIQLDESGGNVLEDNNVSNNGYNGIRLVLSSDGNTLTGNNAFLNNETGIVLLLASDNIVTGNNAFLNNETGILLVLSSNNILTGNTVSNNECGIELSNSGDNVLTGNNASNNRYDFGVLGDIFSHFNNHVDTSNMVDGKPVYYLIGLANAVFDAQTNAGTVYLINSNNITITDLTLTKNINGVFFFNTKNSKIENVTSSNNVYGIQLSYSDSNALIGNNISNNVYGVWLSQSGNNTLTLNTVRSNNAEGLRLWLSSNNTIFRNNFISNNAQVFTYQSTNRWDNTIEGNYWSDYNGTDDNQDGIGESPYIIDENNQGNCPLMGMFYDFTVEIEWGQIYPVHVISNFTVSNLQVLWWLTSPNEYLQPGDKFILFVIVREEGSVGFCRMMIPRAVLNDSYIVLVDWHEVPVTELAISNSTHAYLYFAYQHSTHEVIVIPEFPTWTSMLLMLIMLTVVIVIYKRRLLCCS